MASGQTILGDKNNGIYHEKLT
uniref:Uncharacterized protein n=1 Tax=Rhizophora mucronata TaxID=61149 RepID=A0A2P2P5W6_RHIMU